VSVQRGPDPSSRHLTRERLLAAVSTIKVDAAHVMATQAMSARIIVINWKLLSIGDIHDIYNIVYGCYIIDIAA